MIIGKIVAVQRSVESYYLPDINRHVCRRIGTQDIFYIGIYGYKSCQLIDKFQPLLYDQTGRVYIAFNKGIHFFVYYTCRTYIYY